MSARARRTHRSEGCQMTLDDDQQQALLEAALRERSAHEQCGDDGSPAFGELWTSQQAWLVCWARNNLPAALRYKLEADDVVQEIAFRACRRWDDCQGVTIAAFRGWLVTIGKSCLADVRDYATAQCRRAAREEPLDKRAIDRGEQRPKAGRADEIALIVEAEAFERWVAAQAGSDWLILVWHECDGVSADEIARRIGCSTRTVQRTCRALRATALAMATEGCFDGGNGFAPS